MDAIKHLLHVVLDLLETLVLLFAEAATQALKLWTQFLNAPVELLAISAIFKEITGTELTCINAVCYAFAVPFTLLFKIFAGHAPFKNVTAEHVSDDIRALTPSDDLLIARGCLQICHAPFDAYVDVIGSILSRIGTGPTRFVNATTFIIPSINAALSYGSISTPGATPQAITNWSISTCGPLLSIVWLSITGFKKGPRGDPDGYSLLCLLGATGFGTGIWHACEPEDSSSKTTALIVAQFLGPLSNCGKVLRAVENPLAIVGMLVMDIVSNREQRSSLVGYCEVPDSTCGFIGVDRL
ncbi:hypothetical protein SERLA73DRAFT_178852 [Serpula lacrymans var. lacrymans S7.3]|uniref:Uncharacterized protein n=2 Tax=Serpula lacrymans var. lacrymans TaxID=341189 RepID=F8PT48_SERL3|nr:uncharacterized protein SERLADRAFT_463629 [Serpula lacrymans var. lacrymans S7.9]EGO00878.1 hypothetical protein SERLA73DRAFT_178852 [Serpula lacrymans var. lacrymans S7.3]EGO26496.1 hypothetical protein SERLADRAFT_463629 [Serpula lacrymans var. lacrymans S7.9]